MIARSMRRRARGATLLELLVVILIVVTITAATVPAIAPATSSRRTREGARLLNVFLNAARNRAMETGRPAGVWMDRVEDVPEAVATLSFCEVPPPYSGDFSDSTAEVFVWPMNYTDYTADAREFWNIVVPKTKYTRNTDVWANAAPRNDDGNGYWDSYEFGQQSLIRPGDEILLAYQGRRFPLMAALFPSIDTARKHTRPQGPYGPGWYWYIGYGINRRTFVQPTAFDSNFLHSNGTYAIRFYDANSKPYGDHPVVRPAGNWKDNPVNLGDPWMVQGVPYQIIRRPVKSASGSVELPETVCIDLNYSTVSRTGTDVGLPLHPRFDPNDPDSNYTYRIRGKSVYPEDTTPVILMFAPSGAVERVYHHVLVTNPAQPNPPTFTWKGEVPTAPIWFLVGKRTKVPASDTYRAAGVTRGDGNPQDQFNNNWLDLENYWVTINPQNGFITTTELSDFVDNDDTKSINPINVAATRYWAVRSMNMGGR